MILPEIRIKDAFLLRQNASTHLHELWGKDSKLADESEMQDIVNSYIAAWKPSEELILTGMITLLNVEFHKNVIDVYIAPWFYAFSDPLVIGVVHSSDEFVDILTHELIHVLLTDNKIDSIDSKGSKIGDKWKTLFGSQHSFDTLVHIPVHAIHKKIYLGILKDENRLRRDIETVTKNDSTDYIKSWQYVEQHGEDEIISKLISAMKVKN